jgi:hypothetical protein
MNLQEIRQKYPQYGDITDADLAAKLHQKFYADMPFADFASRIGYQAAPEAGLMSGLSNLPGPVPLTDTPVLPNLTMPDLSGLPGPVPLTETPDLSAVPEMLKGLARPPEPQIDIPMAPAPAHVPNLLNVLTPSHAPPPPAMMVLPGGAGHYKGMPLGEPPISQEQAIGGIEMLGNLATAPVGLAGAGAAGIGAGIAGQGLSGIAKAAQEAAQGLTLQPSTEAGREMSGVMMAPFEALQGFDDKLAETIYQKTGSPFLGALLGTAPELLIAAIPFLGRLRRGPGRALTQMDAAEVAEGLSEGARLRTLAKTDPEAFKAAFEESLKRRMPPEAPPEAQGPTIPKGPPPTPPEMPIPPRGPEISPQAGFKEEPYAAPLRKDEGPLSVGGRIERGRGPGEGGQDIQLHPEGGGAPPLQPAPQPTPPQAGPAVQKIAPPADPGRILGAYQDLKKAQGYSNVAISDIRDKAGITQEQMDAFLRDPANVEKYGVSLSGGEWSTSPEQVRSGVVTFPGDTSDMGAPRKYLLAKFEPTEAEALEPKPKAAPAPAQEPEAPLAEPQFPPAAEPQVKIEPKGDTIEVKPKLTKAEEKALTPTKQKKYLLAEVDAAIKLAPAEDVQFEFNADVDTPKWRGIYKAHGAKTNTEKGAVREKIKQEALSKIQTVTIHVPGDGDFTILNSKPALKAFKERAKKFPTTRGDGARKPTVPSTKPTGKRLDDFQGWYYNPFQVRKGSIIEREPNGGKAGKPKQYKNGGFFSDGSYIVQVTNEPKLKHPVATATKPEGAEWGAPDLADHIKQLSKEKKYQPVELAAELFDNAYGANDTAPVLAHVKLNGKDQIFQAKYVDSVLTEHPGAKPFARMEHENDLLLFKDGGKLVGAVLPIKLNSFRFTEEIQKHFTPPPKEAPKDEAGEVSASRGRYATDLMTPERLSREVSVKYQTEDGATATVKQAADEALSEIDEQAERMRALQKCLES